MPRFTVALIAFMSYGKPLPAPVVLIVICLSVFAALTRTYPTKSAGRVSTTPSLARLSERVTIKATNRANPAVHLNDGRGILTAYNGPRDLRTALEQSQAEPLSLASADFDEDGVPDLITGYSFQGRGIVTLVRGNVDAIYPNSLEAQQRRANGTFTDAPFLSPAYVFSAPVAAAFVGAGDFDGDSHSDVIAASTQDAALYLLTGNGKGEFPTVKKTALPGLVTAFAAGEINRRDGLTDVVVGIDAPTASQVLVFEGPTGALNSPPEVLSMPSRVGSLALGQLDKSYETDLIVASGSELIFVHGRDRQLLADPDDRVHIAAPRLEHRSFPGIIRELAVGDFKAQQKLDAAVLMDDGKVHVLDAGAAAGAPLAQWKIETLEQSAGDAAKIFAAKVSSLPGDELLVSDAAARSVQIVRTASKTPNTKMSVADRGLLSTIQSVGGAPIAILPMRLNSDAFSDLAIVESGQASLTIVTSAAGTTFDVNSSADTDDGQCTTAINGCTLREAINAAENNNGADTISFHIGSGPQTIVLQSRLPNILDPVTIDAFTQPGFADKPLIELNGANSTIDFAAFELYASNNTVRGFVINRFHSNGLSLQRGSGNIIEGNYIGTNAAGTVALPNDFRGIGIGGDTGAGADPSSNNRIGGTAPQARNVISGNKVHGIRILNPSSTGNIVQGNYIGTDVTGTVGLGNQFEGVYIGGSTSNTVGGTDPGAGNVISSNGSSGTGRAASGIHIAPLTPLGIGATGNLVQGNRVGTNAGGTAALANSIEGVVLEDGAASNTIGGATTAARNIISGNGTNGLDLGYQNPVTLNQIVGNFIGTDITGELPIGNHGYGIFINVNSDNNTVRDNRIAFNDRGGIFIPNSTGDTGTPGVRIHIDTNSIYANGGLGIDLGDEGITENDFKDPDVGGNLQQNFPILTSVTASNAPAETVWERAGEVGREMPDPVLAATLTINGTLNSTPNGTFTVQWNFYAATQCTANQANSQVLQSGKIPVTTDGNGDAQFTFPFDFPPGITSGVINCTATGNSTVTAGTNTSEFSPCLPVTAPAPSSLTNVQGSGTYGGTSTLTATLASNSTPLSGKTITFTLNSTAVCGGSTGITCPTTNASGIATLSGVSLAGINAGSYPSAVGASFAGDATYSSKSGTGQLTVQKATATITLSNLTQVFNGTPKFASASTTPSGLTVNITYSQNGNPVSSPTSMGAYAISAIISDANYQGSTTGTLNIAPAILLETGTGNLGAVDAVTLTRGPFALTNSHNYSSDQRTRILFFTTDLGFAQSTQPDINTLSVQVNGKSYTVERVGPNTTISGSEIVFLLPSDLPAPGTHPLGIRINGVNSANSPNLQIAGSPGSPATTPKSNKTTLAEYLLFSILDLMV